MHPAWSLHETHPMIRLSLTIAALLCLAVAEAQDFVHWEVPHVRPLEISADGTRLYAVNTADHRLEVFDSSGDSVSHLGSIPVGLAPVSVRARTPNEVWVVNHISDSVSVVRFDGPGLGRVVATLDTDDEPCDVVFAGSPQRAFVSCSQVNAVQVFDPVALGAPVGQITINGEDPRALAVSPDGTRVYAAIFESGNGTTSIGGPGLNEGGYPPDVVSLNSGPYGGQNPPRVAHIVRKDDDGRWYDDNGTNWSRWVSGNAAHESGRPVGWDLVDHDVAIIDTTTLGVTYAERMMNICMALAVNPVTGVVHVVGTDATNEIRFEPNLNGTFVRVMHGAVAGTGGPTARDDLNPHLTYTTSSIPAPLRKRSVGDPRGISFAPDGLSGFVTGMGSNNIVAVDGSGKRVASKAPIRVASGPTGLVHHPTRTRLFVLGRFEGALSVVDLESYAEVQRVAYYDPTPEAIKNGRPFLYDTHTSSGLGQASCGSCHVDARMDRLAWDLGNPAGDVKSVDGQNLAAGVLDDDAVFDDFHPMKGPMVTQTLQDIIGKEPLHWRGDKDGIEEFNGAYPNLQGDDARSCRS